MWYEAAADVLVVIHLLFIGFVVGGVFLAWRWPWIVWAHIPAVIYGALVEFAGFTCPLTLLENDLRRRAGQAGYRGGFIAHYLVKVIYPPGLTRGMQIGLGLLVLLVAIIGYRGFLRRHPPGSVRGVASLIHLAGDRPGVRHRAHVPELVRVAHGANRLDLPVEYVERHGKEHPVVPIAEDRSWLAVHLTWLQRHVDPNEPGED
jgi:hypothetical protein